MMPLNLIPTPSAFDYFKISQKTYQTLHFDYNYYNEIAVYHYYHPTTPVLQNFGGIRMCHQKCNMLI